MNTLKKASLLLEIIFPIIRSEPNFNIDMHHQEKYSAKRIGFCLVALLTFLILPARSYGQSDQCVYPIIFAHGFTGNQDSWIDFFDESRIAGIYGSTQLFHGVINANTQSHIWGADVTEGTADDDVLLSFSNLSNDLSPGCLYAYNWENYWNENLSDPQILIQDGSSPSFFSSDSNESATYKQGYALGVMIDKVLLANPDKDHVLVVGHSMGGLVAREYLQRDAGKWWARSGADGHRIKKLVTLATPHRGSNLFGNPFPSISAEKGKLNRSEIRRDGFPDINSEATRDLRYSFATSTCFPFVTPRHSPYLYGGEEGCIAAGFWNDDVNADGDENDTITGINEAGAGDPEDGSVDNPAMPLPQNLRYTYITSSVDLVVSEDRQSLFDGTGPRPRDPASPSLTHLLSDTLDVDAWHLSQTDEIEDIVRAIDEGDYPKYAWRISEGTSYLGLANFRSTQAPAPENDPSDDPDWFVLDLSLNPAPDLECNVVFNAGGNGLDGRLDFFTTAPTDFSNANAALFTETSSTSSLLVSGIAPGNYYIRVYHEGVSKASWEAPYSMTTTCIPLLLPVELSSFDVNFDDRQIHVSWSTSSEVNSLGFEIETKTAGDLDWQGHGLIDSKGGLERSVEYSISLDLDRPGRIFVRLKQIDFDGAVWNSPALEIDIPQESELVLGEIFPNPFQGRASLDFSVAVEQSYTAELFDTQGHLIRVLQSGVARPGETIRLRIEDLDLSNGVYIMRLRGERFSEERLLTKLR